MKGMNTEGTYAMDGGQLDFTSDTENLAPVREAITGAALTLGFSEGDAAAMALAASEAISNIIEHAYGGRSGEPIQLCIAPIRHDGRLGLQLVFDDSGPQVDPSSIVGRDLEDLRPGGLGTHIIRAVMDEVEYLPRPGGGMRLRLAKYLAG
jgi:anti-sigma regulatory factor (Ser/Thr protein kinase)